MSKLQTWLERACYEAGMQRWPEMMSERGWDCAEAVKLDDWEGLCKEGWELFKLGLEKDDVSALFASLGAISDVLVDRSRLGVGQIDRVLVDAETFLEGLQGKSEIESIRGLRSKVQEAGCQLAGMEKRARERESKELAEVRIRLLRQEEKIRAKVMSEIRFSQEMARLTIEGALQEAETEDKKRNKQNEQDGLWEREKDMHVNDYELL